MPLATGQQKIKKAGVSACDQGTMRTSDDVDRFCHNNASNFLFLPTLYLHNGRFVFWNFVGRRVRINLNSFNKHPQRAIIGFFCNLETIADFHIFQLIDNFTIKALAGSKTALSLTRA